MTTSSAEASYRALQGPIMMIDPSGENHRVVFSHERTLRRREFNQMSVVDGIILLSAIQLGS